MDGDAGEGIYRAMIEEDGMPKLGTSAVTLGIRLGKDIVADQAGLVHRPAFRPKEKNGLSCSRTIATLPVFALPVEWGGISTKTVVWRIEEDDLPVELVSGDDAVSGNNRHVSIGPGQPMLFDDYVKAMEATRPKWKEIQKS
jgi:hypothetical protein